LRGETAMSSPSAVMAERTPRRSAAAPPWRPRTARRPARRRRAATGTRRGAGPQRALVCASEPVCAPTEELALLA
jgi:hypothetical protein